MCKSLATAFYCHLNGQFQMLGSFGYIKVVCFCLCALSVAVPTLLPYKPHGSSELFYVPQADLELFRDRSDTTVESSHSGMSQKAVRSNRQYIANVTARLYCKNVLKLEKLETYINLLRLYYLIRVYSYTIYCR